MGQLMLPGMDHQPELPGMEPPSVPDPAQGQLGGMENQSSTPTHHIINPQQFGGFGRDKIVIGRGKPAYKQPKGWSAHQGVVTWNDE